MQDYKIDTLNLTSLAGSIFILVSTIPWFGLPVFDSQPFPLFFATVFIILTGYHIKIPQAFLVICFSFLFAIVLGSVKGFKIDFLLIRGIINYLGIVVYLIAFHEYLKRFGFPKKILIISNIIWIVVGVIHVFQPEFLSQFTASRTSLERGVTSLAPEPSYFGIYLFFSSWLILLGDNYQPSKRVRWLLVVNLFGILLLAQSAMIAIYLFLAAGCYILNRVSLSLKINLRNIASAAGLLAIVYLLYSEFLVGTRIYSIINLISTENLFNLLKVDASITQRIRNVVLPIHGFIFNDGMPGGFHSYSDIAQNYLGNYFGIFSGVGNNKIMSWNGSLFYEMGIFAVVFWSIIINFVSDGTRTRYLELLLIFTILFSSVPLAFPLVPFVIILLLHRKTISREDEDIKIKLNNW